MNGIYRRTSINNTPLCPLRPLCEPQRISHWSAFIGAHQPKNISASPRLRVSHRVSRNERHLSTHINQQYASASSAPSVRATAYLALVGIHRCTPTKKHLCVLCALCASHSVSRIGRHSSAYTNQKTSPRLRVLCASHRVSRNERHLSTHINQQYASVSSAPSVRDKVYLAMAGIHRCTPTKKHLCVSASSVRDKVYLAMAGIHRCTPTKKHLCVLCVLCASHRVSRNERHLSTHINQQYASVSSAPSVRDKVYLALAGIHRYTPTKKHLCVLCALCASHSVSRIGRHSSAHSNQKTSLRPLRPLCETNDNPRPSKKINT
jgi:ArsR family metal-binding transcriptional regulator